MVETRKLDPKETAQAVLEDIQNDPEKTKKFGLLHIMGNDFFVGNMILNQLYGTLTSGSCDELYDSLKEQVLNPLNLDLVARRMEDIPADAWMTSYLGQEIKNLA